MSNEATNVGKIRTIQYPNLNQTAQDVVTHEWVDEDGLKRARLEDGKEGVLLNQD